MVDIALGISVGLLVLVQYGFMRVSFEVFTYKKPGRVPVFVVSMVAVLASLFISYLLGFLTLLAFLASQRLSRGELVIVLLTTEFGFLMGMAVVMFILTSVGFILDVSSLKVNMSPEEVMRFLGQ